MNFKKMTAAEIRELVSSGGIDLSALSKKNLQIIFNKELEEQTRRNSYDMATLNMYAEAFERLDRKKYASFWDKKYTADEFYEMSVRKSAPEADADVTAGAHMHVRRRWIIAAAAAVIIMAALSIGAIADFEPFADFGVTIKDLFHMNGGVITGDNSDLYISNSYAEFDTLEELSNSVGFGIVYPSDGETYKITSVLFTIYDNFSSVKFNAQAEGQPKIECSIEYGEETNEAYNEEVIAGVCDAYVYHGYNVYFTPFEEKTQAMLFYKDKVYIMVSATQEAIEAYLNAIDNWE